MSRVSRTSDIYGDILGGAWPHGAAIAQPSSLYGETPFRNFAHRFYAMLPLKKKRTEKGLDEVIVGALDYRRKHSEKG
jgi:hypothetical protein